jgi:LPXTG-motif cell wall-anchored protein
MAQTSVDRSFTAVSKDCSGIEWSDRSLATYPTIASACQGVEQRNGKTYVRFEGAVKRNVERGQQLVVNFKDGGEVTLTPPPETNLYVNGKRTAVADLQRGDQLNFYISEDRLAAQFPETEVQSARLIVVPIVVHETTQHLAATLPHTASSLPLLAVGGIFTLCFGGLLTLYRRRR